MKEKLFHYRSPLLKPRNQFLLLFGVVLAVSLHRLLLFPESSFNNFFIFRASFANLLHGVDLYAPHPEQYFDLYKYSPSFAALMGIFHLLPGVVGATLWNLLNALLPWWGIRRLNISEQWKAFLLCFVLIELVTSVINAQSNGIMTGLLLLAFSSFERKRVGLAALFLVLGFYIKLFAAVGGLLFVFYPQRIKFLLSGAAWLLGIAALPLLFTSPDALLMQYKSWLHLLANDPAHELNFSLMTLCERWFGLHAGDVWFLIPGALLLMLPLLRTQHWQNVNFRRLYLAAILVWTVIFNHKAESPTFIIAITGIGLWAVGEAPGFKRAALLWLAFVGTQLVPTDLFPHTWRTEFFVPYAVKAFPAIVMFGVMMWTLWRRKYFGEKRL
ncbi:MAG: DUF2029 domain-containing protein [Bacteroidia bacterium]|jgi:hypothetical protein|nr:DUF2029 domain-containing protein [Bacteroidia bacterium]